MEKEKSYQKEKHLYNSTWDIPYGELLQFKEWKEFRKAIIDRDNHTCVVCNQTATTKYKGIHYRELSEAESMDSQQTIVTDLTGDGEMVSISKTARYLNEAVDSATVLHVHHRYYIFGDAPWEYPESAMITVCHDCHWDIHAQGKVPTYVDEKKSDIVPLDPCTRCNGTGFMKEYHYHLNGICFRCKGRKFEQYRDSKPRG